MKRYYPRTYRSRRPVKILMTVLLTLLIAGAILMVSLFFAFRQYIVYEPDGTLHLEIPWLADVSPSDVSSSDVSPAAASPSAASPADESVSIVPVG